MTLVGQPPPSPALQKGFELLAQGKYADAETTVKKAALAAKAQHGSGSHPLALAYAELARLHLRMGDVERAAKEFQHAAGGAMPPDPQQRRDRLSFLFGYGAALGEAGKYADAEKVLRQCAGFARNLGGSQSVLAHLALVPLADVLLRSGKTAEAAKLANEAYDALWKLGDPQFGTAVGTRAEALKATGRQDDPFADLDDLPDEIVTAAVATTLARAGKGDPGRVRAVLSDLLGFVDKKFGEGHAVTCDTLAAVAHHEAAAGDKGDEKLRRTAVRRAVWSYAVRRVPDGLLSNLEIGFEPGGGIHLAPHLAREPDPAEAAQLEKILTEAVDDLYSRPSLRP
jgi:tetratricopeptide (TPR) repeat protein